MIRFEDLFKECATCEGSGRVEDFPTTLHGAPTKLSGQCPTCEGTGGEFTEQGRELKRFVDQLHRRR